MSTNEDIYSGYPFDDEDVVEEPYSEIAQEDITFVEDPDELTVLPPLVPVFDDLAAFAEETRNIESYDQDTGLAVVVAPDDADEDPTPIGRTWAFNFDTGEFDMPDGGAPRKLEDNDDAIIQQWIRRCLTTERYIYDIYPDWFGVELEPVFGGKVVGPPALIHTRSTIEEALLQHDRIEDVQDLFVSEEDGTIIVTCTVVLDRGNEVPVELSVAGG